jgi:hypothetical protein
MTFKELESTDIVLGRSREVSQGMFLNASPIVEEFFTSSEQTQPSGSEFIEDVTQGSYFVNVYDLPPVDASGLINPEATVTLNISYGHKEGSGSYLGPQGEDNTATEQDERKVPSATKTMYSQYSNVLLSPNDDTFTFFGGDQSDSIYVIDFATERIRDRMDEGNFVFQLGVQAEEGGIVYSASVSFIDDSRAQTNQQTNQEVEGGKVFNIAKGNFDTTEITDDDRKSVDLNSVGGKLDTKSGLGLFYPDLGVVVLNATAIANLMGDELYEQNINGFVGSSQDLRLAGKNELLPDLGTNGNKQNFLKLYDSLNRGLDGNPNNGAFMQARSTEFIPAQQIFVRVKNQEFNYTNNPTFVFTRKEAKELAANSEGTQTASDIEGRVRYEDFFSDPKTYITTVGLYNDRNELLAVAKLSNPISKTFDSEMLIKIKIDF